METNFLHTAVNLVSMHTTRTILGMTTKSVYRQAAGVLKKVKLNWNITQDLWKV